MNKNICQFYIVFGNKNFVAPQNNDVYINATNINNIDDLSKQILDSYKEKAKLGNKVGSEIIFLIPDEKFRQKTENLIKELKVNGKIELLTPSVKTAKIPEEPKKQILEPTISELKPEKPTLSNNTSNELKQINVETKEQLIEESKTPVYKPTGNIYRGNIDNNTYTNFNKPKKSNKTALIIFIISFIFFIISLLLLFLV